MPKTYKATTITDPESGESFSFGVGEDVPDELVEFVSESVRDAIFEPEEDEFFRDEDGELLAGGNHDATAGDEDPLNKRIKEEIGLDGDTVRNEGDYESMKVPELVTLAEDREIDLGGATKKADIIAVLKAADEDDAAQ